MTTERDRFETGIIHVVDDSEVSAILQAVVGGQVEPDRGAGAIWAQLAEESNNDYPEDLRIFVGLVSEWQDHPKQREALETDIRDEAQKWLDAHRPTAG